MWSRSTLVVGRSGVRIFNKSTLQVPENLVADIRFLYKRPLLAQKVKCNCYQLGERFYSSARNVNVGIFGAPMSKGQRNEGVDQGPTAIRSGGLVTALQKLGIDVKDYGDLKFEELSDDSPNPNARNANFVGAAIKKVIDQVSTVLREDRVCLTLGGDHAIGMGTVLGHSQVHHDLCLLWVDAHADINTAITTNSGNLHGMPCSFFIRQMSKYCPKVPGLEWIEPCLDASNLAYIGLRDVEPSEKVFLEKLNIPHFGMQEIDKRGIHAVVSEALEKINPKGNRSLHVSFDIDSVDKYLAPSTGTPVEGGLTLREAFCIAEEISSTGLLRGLDMVEVNPLLGNEEDVKNTVDAAIRIILAFFGTNRDGNAHLGDAHICQ